MEMREMIFNLHKKGTSPKEIEKILKEEFGKHAYNLSTIYYWIAKAKVGIEDVQDEVRPGRPIDDQLLIRIREVLEEQPFSSINYIANILKSSKATVFRYVTKQLGMIYKHSRWVPHFLNKEQKIKRVQLCSELSAILNKCKKNRWHDIITGDQSWFVYWYGYDGAWLAPEDEAPIMDGSTILVKKIMVTVVWGVYGIYLIDVLPQGQSFNSEYFVDNIITPLEKMKDHIWTESNRRKIWLHLDNCKVHNSKLSLEKTKAAGFKRTPHPPFSPDIAPSDFFLFGYTKFKLKGSIYDEKEDLVKAIREILNGISSEKKKEVFESWIKRCNQVALNGGEYYSKE